MWLHVKFQVSSFLYNFNWLKLIPLEILVIPLLPTPTYIRRSTTGMYIHTIKTLDTIRTSNNYVGMDQFNKLYVRMYSTVER